MKNREEIETRLQSVVEAEKLRQVDEMVKNNTLSLGNKYLYLNGQIRNVGSYIKFDQGYINLAYSQEIDNIARELEQLRLTEQITEEEFGELIVVIN